MPSLVGRTLGKYQIVQLLGRGGMAEVYKAYHPRLDRYVAVKVMHGFLADSKDFVARFEREARAAAALRHPNIVQVHDFDIEDDYYYMVMEFIEGGSLRERLETLTTENHKMGLDEIWHIFQQVGSALDFAHQRGMLHRDIKPANILLDPSGRACLADFGIARILSEVTRLTATGTLIGTPAYMSPETGQGLPAAVASEVYSLGIILFEMIAGKAPFDADTPFGILLKHVNVPAPSPRSFRPEISAALDQVLLKALAKNPEDRFASVTEFVLAVQTTLQPPPAARTMISPPAEQTPTPNHPTTLTQPVEAIEEQETILAAPPPQPTPEPGEEEGTQIKVQELEPAQAEMEDWEESPTQINQEPRPSQPEKPAVIPPEYRLTPKRRSRMGVFIGAIVFIILLFIGVIAAGLLTNWFGITSPTQAAIQPKPTSLPPRPSPTQAPPKPTQPPEAETIDIVLPDQVAALVGDYRVFANLDFKSPEHAGWVIENGEFSGGNLVLSGANDRQAIAIQETPLQEGTAVFLRFQKSADARFVFSMETGEWETDTFKSWRMDQIASLNSFYGKEYVEYPFHAQYSKGPFSPVGGQWIDMIFAINQNAEFIIQLWETENPANFSQYRRSMEEDWNGLDWHLVILVDQGQVAMQKAATLSFQSLPALSEADAYYWSGVNAMMDGDVDKAFSDLEQALQISPNADTFERYAQLLWNTGNVDAAIENFHQGLELNPESASIHASLAWLYATHVNDPDQAMAHVERAIEIKPDFPWNHFFRGWILHYLLDDPQQAVEEYSRAIELYPLNHDFYLNRGMAFNRMEQWDPAIEDCNRCLQIIPDHHTCLLERGWAYAGSGNKEAARQDFERYLNESPEDECPECHEEARHYLEENR